MPRIKALVEKRNNLITRAEEINAAADKEDRDLTDEELKEVEKIQGDVEGVDKQLAAARAVEGMAKDTTAEKEEKTEGDNTEEDKANEAAEERAFEAEIRGMWNEMNTRDDNTPLSKGNNGAVIPLTISRRIIRKLYEISPIAERATKYELGGTLAIPYYTENETDYINAQSLRSYPLTPVSSRPSRLVTTLLVLWHSSLAR